MTCGWYHTKSVYNCGQHTTWERKTTVLVYVYEEKKKQEEEVASPKAESLNTSGQDVLQMYHCMNQNQQVLSWSSLVLTDRHANKDNIPGHT
jgi:hypothetical protein